MLRTTEAFRRLAACVLFVAGAGVVNASTISIDFTGADISFDGTDLTDAGAPADDLSSVTITADSVDSTLTAGISLDFVIPDVDPIPVGGGTVSTGDTGSLTLGLPAGDFLSLDLGEATVTFVDVAGLVQFAFAATVADSGSATQSLPFGLIIGDPILVSLQTSVDSSSIVSSGGFIDSFIGSGTGSIDGEFVPEPTTGLLLGLSAAGFAVFAARKQR